MHLSGDSALDCTGRFHKLVPSERLLQSSSRVAASDRVYVVDGADQSATVAALQSLRLHLVQCKSAKELLDSIDDEHAGCVLVAADLPDMPGIELQRLILERGLPLPIIFLADNVDVRTVVAAMKQGAIDVIEKPIEPAALVDVVVKAIEISKKEIAHRETTQEIEGRLARLDEDELRVLEQITAGKTNKQIAVDAGVSLRTVQFRRSRLMKKLGIASRAALIELLIAARRWPAIEE